MRARRVNGCATLSVTQATASFPWLTRAARGAEGTDTLATAVNAIADGGPRPARTRHTNGAERLG